MSFRDWTWRDGHADFRFNVYLANPDILTLDSVGRLDREAAHTLQRAAQLVEDLKEYRKALAERYAALSVMPYKARLELERRRSWYDKRVTYHVRLVKEYEDGTQVQELEESYPGKERREALARFDALRKERPGIEVRVDTKKKNWER